MPAKTPIYLKSNNTKKGKKCRLRDILSPDMISPPLGDFRHTIHIGKGGECDAFGDMSFLQGKFELLPGKGGMIRPQYGTHGEFMRANSASDASFIETSSPILKNAISLPTIGGSQALTLPLISTTIFPMTRDPLDDLAGPPTPPASSEGTDDLDILQMETLLQSITIFRRDPSPVPEETSEKPMFSINLVEKPPAKKMANHNNILNTKNQNNEKRFTSFFINGNGNENGSSNGTGFYKSSCSNDYNHINNDTILKYEKELSSIDGDWADRDSGVEEGRICDFDFELSKSKSLSQDSLSQANGSLLSLELDLGPSILDEVLNIMSKPEP
ncbi:cdc42 effector protein 3 [Hoplias malabaricus]|uniref:cdc42 effector protein 3 n=1 Tax=Hoplias malabaricus TaxID=27720 RepID=UPI0034629EA3